MFVYCLRNIIFRSSSVLFVSLWRGAFLVMYGLSFKQTNKNNPATSRCSTQTDEHLRTQVHAQFRRKLFWTFSALHDISLSLELSSQAKITPWNRKVLSFPPAHAHLDYLVVTGQITESRLAIWRKGGRESGGEGGGRVWVKHVESKSRGNRCSVGVKRRVYGYLFAESSPPLLPA